MTDKAGEWFSDTSYIVFSFKYSLRQSNQWNNLNRTARISITKLYIL